MTLLRRVRERLAFWRWYLTTYRPIAGAEDPPPDPTPAPEPTPDPTPDPDPKADPGPDPDPEPDPDPDDDTVSLPKGEVERLRRQVAEAAQADRDRKRKEAEAAGKHDEVVRQVEDERDEANKRADEAEAALQRHLSESKVQRIASTLKFHDPADAVKHLPDGVADRDEAAVEKALRDLAKQKPYLVNEGAGRSGAGMSGTGGGEGTLTLDDVNRMSREEINNRWDEVQAALKASKS